MTESFAWQEGYCIGIEEIDAHHQNLFRIANRLQEDLPPGRLREELMVLYRHTREHFAAEEALMRAAAYPGYPAHRDQHDQLLDTLNHYATLVVRDPGQLPALRAFLADWIVEHILNQDQRVAEHLRKGGR
jgi:hemerythrin